MRSTMCRHLLCTPFTLSWVQTDCDQLLCQYFCINFQEYHKLAKYIFILLQQPVEKTWQESHNTSHLTCTVLTV